MASRQTRARARARGWRFWGRLSRLSVRGNLCPPKDHLRITLRHRCYRRSSRIYIFMPILPADAPGLSDGESFHLLRPPASLSQPDRNDYGTARPSFAYSRLFLPALIRGILPISLGLRFLPPWNHSDRGNEWLNHPPSHRTNGFKSP